MIKFNKRHWWLIIQIFISLLFFSIISIIIKKISANPFTIAVARLSMAVVLLTALMAYRKQFVKLTRRQWWILVVLGIIFAGHWLAFFYAIKISTPAIAVIGITTYGMHLIILGWIFDKGSFSWLSLIAVLLAMIGNYFMIPEFSLHNEHTLGFLLAVSSGFMFALLPVIHRKNTGIPGFYRAFGQFFFGWIFFLFFLPYTNWNFPVHEWYYLIFLGVGCTFIAHTLWVNITTQLPTTTTSIIYYINVPIAMFFSYWLVNEPITWQKLAGASLIILANIGGVYVQMKKKW